MNIKSFPFNLRNTTECLEIQHRESWRSKSTETHDKRRQIFFDTETQNEINKPAVVTGTFCSSCCHCATLSGQCRSLLTL